MRKSFTAGAVAAALILMADALPARAAHNTDEHSENMTLVANYNENGEYGLGSDLAFWGDTVVAGSFDGPGGFRLLDISNPTAPKRIGLFDCPGTQADVSIWRDLAFVSVDAPRGPAEGFEAHQCGAPVASQPQIQSGTAWEGVRIVSLANPAAPVQIAAIKTDCGSHTHTIYPDEANARLLIYVLSYPLNPQSSNCNPETHRKISVIEVPLGNPAAAKVISTPSVDPAIGCHDVTVFVPRKLAAAACISESQIWDVKDPANPQIVGRIRNPRINIHHSAAFAWDGEKIVLGDELGGAAVAPGCVGPDGTALGALWFYDVKEPDSPTLRGSYRIPQTVASALCTAHLFNPIPLRSDKDILVASWYSGATTVVDWTDPTAAKQVGFYIPKGPTTSEQQSSSPAAWSSYWYNGEIYSNNYTSSAPRGFDVFGLKLPELADAITLDRLNPQVQEPLPAPVPTRGAGQVIAMPPGSKGSCVNRRRLSIRIAKVKRRRVVSAVVFVNGRRAKVVKGRKLRRPVVLKRLPRGEFRVDVTLRTRSGKRIHQTRTYRGC